MSKKLDLDALKKKVFFCCYIRIGFFDECLIWNGFVEVGNGSAYHGKLKPITIVFSFFTHSLRPFLRMNILNRCWWMPLFHFISLEFSPHVAPFPPALFFPFTQEKQVIINLNLMYLEKVFLWILKIDCIWLLKWMFIDVYDSWLLNVFSVCPMIVFPIG